MPDEPRDPLADLLRTPVPTGRRQQAEPRPGGPDRPGSARSAAWAVPAGMALGIVAVVVGFLVSGAGDDIADDANASTTTTTTTVDRGSGFPEGYAAVTDLVAIHPEAVLTTPDRVLVGFSTAVLRGFDPELSTPFQGGDFTIDYGDGLTQAAEGIVYDSRAAGAFSVAFPPAPAGADAPQRIVLSSRWSRRGLAASVPLDVPAVPYSLPDPLQVGFDDGSSLTIESLSFDRASGRGNWSMPGTSSVGRVTAVIRLTGSGFGQWYLYTDQFFDLISDVIPSSTAAAGSFDLEPDQIDVDVDLSTVDAATLEVFVDLIERTPTEVSIDLDGVPITGI